MGGDHFDRGAIKDHHSLETFVDVGEPLDGSEPCRSLFIHSPSQTRPCDWSESVHAARKRLATKHKEVVSPIQWICGWGIDKRVRPRPFGLAKRCGLHEPLEP